MDDSAKIIGLIRSSMGRSPKSRVTIKSEIEKNEPRTSDKKQIPFSKFYKKKLQEKLNKNERNS